MKTLSPWFLAAIATAAPIGALANVPAAVMGHLAVLAVTVGIFVATLSLGRAPAKAQTPQLDTTTQIEARSATPPRAA